MHSFAHVANAAVFVHIVSFSVRQSSAEVCHVCFFDALPIVNNIETFRPVSQKSYFHVFGFALVNCIFKQLDDPNSQLGVQVFNFDIRSKDWVVVLHRFCLKCFSSKIVSLKVTVFDVDCIWICSGVLLVRSSDLVLSLLILFLNVLLSVVVASSAHELLSRGVRCWPWVAVHVSRVIHFKV